MSVSLSQASRPSVYVELALESHRLLNTSPASFQIAAFGEDINPTGHAPAFSHQISYEYPTESMLVLLLRKLLKNVLLAQA